MSDLIEVKQEAGEVIRMSIVLYADGRLSVEGIPTGPHSLITSYGLLELARQVVAEHARAQPGRIVVPELVPGNGAMRRPGA